MYHLHHHTISPLFGQAAYTCHKRPSDRPCPLLSFALCLHSACTLLAFSVAPFPYKEVCTSWPNAHIHPMNEELTEWEPGGVCHCKLEPEISPPLLPFPHHFLPNSAFPHIHRYTCTPRQRFGSSAAHIPHHSLHRPCTFSRTSCLGSQYAHRHAHTRVTARLEPTESTRKQALVKKGKSRCQPSFACLCTTSCASSLPPLSPSSHG